MGLNNETVPVSCVFAFVYFIINKAVDWSVNIVHREASLQHALYFVVTLYIINANKLISVDMLFGMPQTKREYSHLEVEYKKFLVAELNCSVSAVNCSCLDFDTVSLLSWVLISA